MLMMDAKVEKGAARGTEQTPVTWALPVTAVSTPHPSPQDQLIPSQSTPFPASWPPMSTALSGHPLPSPLCKGRL